jgi:Protein of unknown function (DUF4054)
VAALTTLANIKAIAAGSEPIQGLHDGDVVVLLILDQVDKEVPESIFTTLTEPAQRYLAAHYLSQALQDAEGRGALSSESIGGISQSWTMPDLNIKGALGATQYGKQFLEYRAKRVITAIGYVPAA